MGEYPKSVYSLNEDLDSPRVCTKRETLSGSRGRYNSLFEHLESYYSRHIIT